jgi:His/Glu/Gln/Arg/opine family amino acid ABC transporter permease subunit
VNESEAEGAAAVERPPFLQRVFTRENVARWGVGIAAVVAVFGILYFLGTRQLYNLDFAVYLLHPVEDGFAVTMKLVAVVIPLGFTLGFLLGWGRTTRSLLFRGLGAVYVDFFRSMPPIVLIFFSYLLSALVVKQLTGSPFIARDISLWMGAIALAFHSGSYQAEIIRAGILSVPTGQLEAADSIGMSRLRSMFSVVLPQAFRVSLPALGNEFSSVIKDTSLLSLIGWVELAQTGIVQARTVVGTMSVFVVWIEVAIMYFALTYVVTRIVRAIENNYKVPGLEAAEL